MKTKVRKMVSRLSAPVLRRAASSYVAGPEIDDALRVALRLQHMGFTAAIGFWNSDHDSPRLVADAYLQSLAAMPERGLDNLCIKLPALHYSCNLLEEVLCMAKKLNVRVHFDSHGPETMDRTLSALDHVLSAYPNVGITIPARWKRSLRDIDWAVERKLPVRIVKGQWPDGSSVNPDRGFVSAMRRLAGRVARVNVATHNAKLARQSLECLHAAGTRGEMDLLYGLPVRHSLAVAKHFAVPVRFYIPFGHAWLPYCFSQARKNPRILLWMLKDSLFSKWGESLAPKRML